ncbi:MAG TPA: L-aspartate oxidase [Ktedonobacterales bacterium]|nr:L-aspartate oxidase [Ktedonobacterales bacterium]
MTGPTEHTPARAHATARPDTITDTTSNTQDFDLIIVGGGVAGLSVLLSLPAQTRVALLTKAALGESNTRYAQGGLAAPVGLDDDPELQLRDTLTAGAGLVDEAATRAMLAEAREAVAWLVAQGTQFDERQRASATAEESAASDDPLRALATRYDLTLEAAHSRRRVLHAHGDATGAEIERALVAAARSRPHTTVYEHALALDLALDASGACVGVDALIGGRVLRLRGARGVALANGGAGRLWLRTSNPAGATADGVALAWRAGAALADLEFCQFHPTTLAVDGPDGQPFLVSEAVRGEGAWLRNTRGERFMPRYHPDAELAPRDVVARAILSEMLAEDAPSAFLDLRHLPAEEARARFPSITAACKARGLDLATDLIPVAPAAHYYMGGVVTDTWGRTTVPQLYAIGEVSCTGVHGANRLASNSLLEGLVFGRRAARLIGGAAEAMQAAGDWPTTPALTGPWVELERVIMPHSEPDAPIAVEVRGKTQRLMWQHVSLRRDAGGLTTALERLRALAAGGPYDAETANMLLVAQGVTLAALSRAESRGGHYRTDYPQRETSRDGRHTMLWPTHTPQPTHAGQEEQQEEQQEATHAVHV